MMQTISIIPEPSFGYDAFTNHHRDTCRRNTRPSVKADLTISWALKCRMFSGYLSIAVLGIFIVTVSAVHVTEARIRDNGFLFWLCIFGLVGGLLMVGGAIFACTCCFTKADRHCCCWRTRRCSDTPRGQCQAGGCQGSTNRPPAHDNDPPPYELSANSLPHIPYDCTSCQPPCDVSHAYIGPHLLHCEGDLMKPPPYGMQAAQPPQYDSVVLVDEAVATSTGQDASIQTQYDNAQSRDREDNTRVNTVPEHYDVTVSTQGAPPPYEMLPNNRLS